MLFDIDGRWPFAVAKIHYACQGSVSNFSNCISWEIRYLDARETI